MMRLKCEDHFKISSILWTFQLFRNCWDLYARTCGREHFNSQKIWIPKIECENFIEMKTKCHYLHSICDIINPTFRLDVTDPTLPWSRPLGLAFQKLKNRVGFIVSKMSNTIPNLILAQRHLFTWFLARVRFKRKIQKNSIELLWKCSAYLSQTYELHETITKYFGKIENFFNTPK